MQSLALSGGDLLLGSGGLQTVTGAAKIRQDVALALGETYGNDPYEPLWGSVLSEYVGRAITSDTPGLIQAEVNRVLQQYMNNQQATLKNASTNRTTTTLTTSDIIRTVNSVDVSVYFDTVKVVINLTTMAGQNMVLSRTVS
jgi:phage baseplate assembly protein W